jgi:Domain of unknown function (DUF4157)
MLHAPVSENKTQDKQSKTQSEPESERRVSGWAGYPALGLGGENGSSAGNERAQGWQPINLSTLSQGGILQRKCACGSSAGAAGTCGKCQSKEGMLQTKLSIGASDDKYEREADRVADEVMRMPEPTIQPNIGSEQKGGIQRKAIANSITPLQRSSTAPNQASEVPDIVHDVLRSPGQPLDLATRALMEPRFGHDFSHVRIHTGGDADRSARDINARAYTVGKNIVFGASQFAPGMSEGRRLLAHELTHVVQQNSNLVRQDTIQLSRLEDYNSQDPAKLSDAIIESTDDYRHLLQKFYPKIIPASQNRSELLLACRLAVRHMQEIQVSISEEKLESFVSQARKQLGVLKATETQIQHLNWVRFDSGAAVNNPSALPTEFGRWVLAGTPEPNATSGKVNCWEMILFGAYKGKYITFARIKEIYELAVEKVKLGQANRVGDTVESELRGGKENIFNPLQPNSPEPLAGDIVIFREAGDHTVLSLGTKNVSGNHEVLSLWNTPNNNFFVQKTTIEALLGASAPSPVKFWTPRW